MAKSRSKQDARPVAPSRSAKPNPRKFRLLVRQGYDRRKALRLAGYRPKTKASADSLAYKILRSTEPAVERPIPEFEVIPPASIPPAPPEPTALVPIDPLTAIFDRHRVGSEPGIKIDRAKFASDLKIVHSPEVFEVVPSYQVLTALHPGLADDLTAWHKQHVRHVPSVHTELGRRALLKEIFLNLDVPADTREKVVNWLTFLQDWSDFYSLLVCPPHQGMTVENISEANERLYNEIRHAFRTVSNLPLLAPSSMPVPVRMGIEQEIKEQTEASDVWRALEEWDSWGNTDPSQAYPTDLIERAMSLPDDEYFTPVKRRALTLPDGRTLSPDHLERAREAIAKETERRQKLREKWKTAIEAESYVTDLGGRVVPVSQLMGGPHILRVGKGMKELRAKKTALRAEAARIAADEAWLQEQLQREALESTKDFVEVMEIRRANEQTVNPESVPQRAGTSSEGAAGISELEGAAPAVAD